MKILLIISLLLNIFLSFCGLYLSLELKNPCKECDYYHPENNTCQSKKCATMGYGYVDFMDRLFCKPYKAGEEKKESEEEQSEQNVGMCQQTVGEMSEKQTDGDLISCLNEWSNAYKDLLEDIRKMKSAEKTTLSEEKTTITDGDLISRDFMEKLGATCIATRNEKGELVAISSIDNLPSAEKTAEWILFDDESNAYKCSNCKDAFILLEGTPTENNYNYCPNCGVRMEGESNGKTEIQSE